MAVYCAQCNKLLEENPAITADKRIPCPDCGSTSRVIDVSASIHAYASASAVGIAVRHEISELPGLLLKTIIKPSSKTEEGRLIEAALSPRLDIIQLLDRDPSRAYEIPPEKWEEIVAGAYCKSGFDEVTLTPRSGDYGRDVIAIKKGLGSVRVIDQVKAYKPENLVTADHVRALVGVLQMDGANKGFLTTTSNFAPRLPEDPLISPLLGRQIELIDGKTLLRRLSEIAKR